MPPPGVTAWRTGKCATAGRCSALLPYRTLATVVLSSHLLDEVQRTCDAVAIVDRGSIIQQGPIAELLAGASVAPQVECSEPGRAGALLAGTILGARIEAAPAALGLEIMLPAGTGRDVSAEVNRILVAGGISVDRLQPVQNSLESWFLQVTSRPGDLK